VLVSHYTRRSTRPGFPAVVSCHCSFKLSPARFCRIRTSENPRLQALWNPHLQERFRSADSKKLIPAEWCLQPFCNQHMRSYSVSAENAGLITPLESALTESSLATPLESALPKNRGEGASTPQFFAKLQRHHFSNDRPRWGFSDSAHSPRSQA
jgi:hypothetical protein